MSREKSPVEEAEEPGCRRRRRRQAWFEFGEGKVEDEGNRDERRWERRVWEENEAADFLRFAALRVYRERIQDRPVFPLTAFLFFFLFFFFPRFSVLACFLFSFFSLLYPLLRRVATRAHLSILRSFHPQLLTRFYLTLARFKHPPMLATYRYVFTKERKCALGDQRLPLDFAVRRVSSLQHRRHYDALFHLSRIPYTRMSRVFVQSYNILCVIQQAVVKIYNSREYTIYTSVFYWRHDSSVFFKHDLFDRMFDRSIFIAWARETRFSLWYETFVTFFLISGPIWHRRGWNFPV